MRIVIDADGCPVIDIAIDIAQKYALECILICDTAHYFDRPGARTIMVSKGADSVDFVLVNMVQAGDIVITQDYGLASMCLARRAVPLNQNGLVFTNENMLGLLGQRHVAQKARRAGVHLRGGHASKRTKADDLTFTLALEELIVAHGV
jgi:uncharacterized protein YaiI (UPF0178 family)